MTALALSREVGANLDCPATKMRLAEVTAASRAFVHNVQNLLGVPTILVSVLEAERLSPDTRLLLADTQLALDQLVAEARALQTIVCGTPGYR
jgi:hypothetical protein